MTTEPAPGRLYRHVGPVTPAGSLESTVFLALAVLEPGLDASPPVPTVLELRPGEAGMRRSQHVMDSWRRVGR